MTIKTQLRLLSLVAMIIMVTVIAITASSLNRLRLQFANYQSGQVITQSLGEFKAAALSIAHEDPIMMETGAKLSAVDKHILQLQEVVDARLATSTRRTQIDALFAQWQEYLRGFRGALKMAEDSPQDALNIPDALYKLKLMPMVVLLDKQVNAIQQDELVARKTMDHTMSQILWLVLVPILVGGSLVFAFQMYFSSRLRRRLAAIGEAGARLSEGDLGCRLPGPFNDEIGKMSVTINSFVERFEAIVGDVQTSADLTWQSAEQLGKMSNTVAGNAQLQSDRILQVGRAVEDMVATVDVTNGNVNQAAEAAEQSHEQIRHGNVAGQETVAALQRIDQVVESSSASLQELSSSVALIEKMSSVIRDIAEQTNLLALNAAIEAARAGEQGRGFAVVADEVRQLSQRTTASTTEISSMVQNVRLSAEEATTVMGRARAEVSRGVMHGKQMAEVLANIDQSINLVTYMMEQNTSASVEQAKVMREIGNNVEAVADISVATAHDMAATRDAITELTTTAEGLHQLVDQFKISGTTTG